MALSPEVPQRVSQTGLPVGHRTLTSGCRLWEAGQATHKAQPVRRGAGRAGPDRGPYRARRSGGAGRGAPPAALPGAAASWARRILWSRRPSRSRSRAERLQSRYADCDTENRLAAPPAHRGADVRGAGRGLDTSRPRGCRCARAPCEAAYPQQSTDPAGWQDIGAGRVRGSGQLHPPRPSGPPVRSSENGLGSLEGCVCV